MSSPLAISQLSKSFTGTAAVANLSFNVEAGTIHGLLGPNGSGKSTTLRCALGLLRPDAGSSTILGAPVSKLDRVRGRLGVAFDRPDLLDNTSVLNNLDYARRLSGLKKSVPMQQLLERVGLGDKLRQRAGTLSLGQKRRLAIARALIGQPELVVLDEPLSGLDSLGVRDMLKLFRELRASGTTLLLSSHRLHEMETVVDRVSIMSRGTLVCDQLLTELLAGRARIHVEVEDAQLARTVLGARCLSAQATDEGHFRLEVDPKDANCAELNESLVAAGCRVHALTQQRASLATVFEELVSPPEEAMA